MIGGLEGYGDIVSVSCTNNEIFLLKGDRDIIRISSRPEGLSSIGLYRLANFSMCLVEYGVYCNFVGFVCLAFDTEKSPPSRLLQKPTIFCGITYVSANYI